MKTKTTRVVTPLAVAIYLVATLLISHLAEAEVAMLKWAFDYDDDDRLTKIINPAGQATRINYSVDKTGRLRKLVRSSEGGSTVTSEFDDLGRLGRMTDSAGRVAYGYDHHGRLNRVAREGTSRITYTHDQMDRITSIRVGDFYRVDYHYDFLGRLKEIETPAGKVSWQYLPGQGQVVRTLPNGVKTFWKRQANGQLEEITHGFFAKPDDQRYSLLAQYQYSHGPDGRIAKLKEQSPQGEIVRQYSYDAMGRLTNATGPGNDEFSYEYDLVGNRTRARPSDQQKNSYAHDWAGRLTSIDSEPVAHDANGNLTEVTINGKARQYRYHADGRLAAAHLGDEKVDYGYDGIGRLISRKSTAGETRFIPDPMAPYWQPLVIEEPDGEQTIVIWDGPTPLALMRGSDVQWLLHDHLGSVRLVTDAEGGVVRRSDYDPFGEPLDSAPFTTIAPGFAGLFRDKVAGGYLTLARVFAPELGSFLQPDPQKPLLRDSLPALSLWTYCRSDPVNLVDLDGREPTLANQARGKWNSFWHAASVWVPTFGHELFFSNRPGPHLPPGNERNFVIEEIIVNAMKASDGDISRAYGTVLTWRNPPKNSTKTYEEYPSNATTPSMLEWRAAENYMYARKYVETGQGHGMFHGNLDTRAGDDAAKSLAGWQISAWEYAHFWGEKLDIDPNWILRIPAALGEPEKLSNLWSGERKPWLPQTEKTREWQYRGYADGLLQTQGTGSHNYAQSVPSAIVRNQPYSKRYGSEIGPSQNIVVPWFRGSHSTSTGGWGDGGRQIGDWSEPTGSMGALFSTTGPGKRGGRGGGITRPPSWKPPGHQGSPPGAQPQPGGKPPPGGRGDSRLSPSPVGGVNLGGAGDTIDGLGALMGVQIDTNGNLILIGEKDGDIELPPLRLDDLVTVFRSVYLHGEGPTVSIDPNPEDPENSAMFIVHSEATKNTYVGWILYQADRLMKSYSQGVDNKTERQVSTQVPGYADVLESIYFGSSNPLASQRKGKWERFWIVPAAANRFEGERRELTLFDVPLKAKTQKMKWVNGSLVDDPTGKSSPGALMFTSWFTKQYEGISAEQYLLPPPESGITEPVPVFTELCQIALMTAVAEKLRDQGVPLPFWMRDYEVKEVPFEHYTPGLEVTRSRQQGNAIRTSRIFGGVELSAQSNAVATYASTADASRAKPAMQETIRHNLKLAADLEPEIAKTVPPLSSKPLQVHQFAGVNRPYRAAPIPGAKTRALIPNRLEEADLFVPFGDGREIRLTRHFNSFFDPKDAWGRGWTMDLPRLQVLRVPVSRKGNEMSYRTTYELLTPLNSLYARFNEVRPVPDYGGSELQVPDSPGPFYGLASAEPAFLQDVETRVVLLKNGQRWHFSETGDLIASEDGPQITIYERDSRAQVPRIIALLGGSVAAEIKLEYSDQGKLVKAAGRSKYDPKQQVVEVSYTYDPSGRLAGVQSDKGTVGYQYDNAQVSSITWTDNKTDAKTETLRSYRYNDRAQLVSEKIGENSVNHVISEVPDGLKLSLASVADDQSEEYVSYDNRMRPAKAGTADGTNMEWIYQQDGSVESRLTAPNLPQITVTESGDGRLQTVSMEGSPTLVAQFNPGGKLTSLREGEDIILSQHWRRDGQLTRTETKEQATSLQYSEHGLLSAVLMHPPGDEQTLTEWQQVQVDSRGAPTQITDGTGLDFQIGYDSSGAVNAALQVTPQGTMGYQLERDDQGRIRAVKSSWGDTTYEYTDQGKLRRVASKRGDRSASMTLADGLVHNITNFQGGITSYDYYEEGQLRGALRRVTTADGLALGHKYDEDGLLSAVAVGEDRNVTLEYDKRGRVAAYFWEPRVNTVQ